MKADWEDAPSKIRHKRNDKPIIIALVMAAGLVTTALMATNLKWQVNDLAKAAVPNLAKPEHLKLPEISTINIKQTAEAAKDVYLEQVNNMLSTGTDYFLCEGFKNGEGGLAESISKQSCKPNPIADMEWIDSEQETRTQRQTVFNDVNYSPGTTVNTVRLTKPQPEPRIPRQQQPYVTVVKETKLNCGPFKEGSVECRRHKARMHQIWRNQCDTGGNSQSTVCQLANRYDLR